ncbi:unnamed protein product [Spirodela intermedia]|uniref:Uncharacterized protein n=2 Tax=Spirodela intermedia TaxID=51605 RepID=A0A7I8IFG0_SPIIN|nr:unnamed protein product [Spirodela intermedia]CAA6656125.1 unnamed protein product [Spirodela intermedia]CAA7391587.1 unnamed protein product [Spirodela intermedia]
MLPGAKDAIEKNTTTMQLQPTTENLSRGSRQGDGGATVQTEDGDPVVIEENLKARVKASAVVRSQSHGAVSWRVPHDAQRGHPGFNVDYDAPKTHPPSHN